MKRNSLLSRLLTWAVRPKTWSSPSCGCSSRSRWRLRLGATCSVRTSSLWLWARCSAWRRAETRHGQEWLRSFGHVVTSGTTSIRHTTSREASVFYGRRWRRGRKTRAKECPGGGRDFRNNRATVWNVQTLSVLLKTIEYYEMKYWTPRHPRNKRRRGGGGRPARKRRFLISRFQLSRARYKNIFSQCTDLISNTFRTMFVVKAFRGFFW